MSWPTNGGAPGPRIRITGGNTLGSIKTANVVPGGLNFSYIQWYRQAGTIGTGGAITWGAQTAIADANAMTYTLTAADVPAPGGAMRLSVIVDGLSVTSDFSNIS